MKFIILAVVSACFFVSCATRHQAVNKQEIMAKEGFVSTRGDYGIVLPKGWEEVTDKNEGMKRVFWTFYTEANTTDGAPAVIVFDGPADSQSVMNSITVVADREHGFGLWYREVLQILNEFGFKIQETGVTTIGGHAAKWCIVSLGDGAIQQMCFLTMDASKLYVFCFSTPYLSEERRKSFEAIVSNIVF